MLASPNSIETLPGTMKSGNAVSAVLVAVVVIVAGVIEYEISLQVNNPNSIVGILYKEGGGVSLSLRQQEIASGIYPSFYQGHGNSEVFGITLKVLKRGLLNEEVEKNSMKNDKTKMNNVAFSLTIRVPVQMKMGAMALHGATTKYDVTCQLSEDILVKSTRMISQQCQTKRI
ncbi:hypothetical protein L6164_016095 [Bauhinia variegata]|uniref:Uncharacterized protein n=1 Tax=Bauhinia variegata TaxID=167791 RepID=A0ACB9NRM8_BAUVA|nr:hypothetical protein L6164_016095 [Bauhinia variegata]